MAALREKRAALCAKPRPTRLNTPQNLDISRVNTEKTRLGGIVIAHGFQGAKRQPAEVLIF
jgi:hypothetical protein